jgi:tetratricopeptide (TPR) repeat protein
MAYYKSDALAAVPDLDQAIEKADDNEARHFNARGKCYGSLKLYPEAIEEFSIVLKLEPEHIEARYLRGCCAF